MFSSYSTSDTEAGLPGGNFKPRFSLYSTDTEEKVASVNKGLDRCAALLQTLISPDREGGRTRVAAQSEQKGKENIEPTNALSRKLTIVNATTQPKHSNKCITPPNEGLPRSHPHCSSTPVPRQLNPRTTTQPVPSVGPPPPTRARANKEPRTVNFGQRDHVIKERRPKRAHRRRQTEPRKPFVVSRNPPKPKAFVTLRNNKPPTPLFTKVTVNPSTINVPPQPMKSSPPPDLPPTHPPVASNGRGDQQWFPYVPLWLPLSYLDHFKTAPLMKNGPLGGRAEVSSPMAGSEGANPGSKPSPSPAKEDRRCSSAPLTRPPNRAGDEVLLSQILELEQKISESGQSELLSCVDSLKSSVEEYCSGPPLPVVSTSHWLEQIEQLEREKSQLLQRVIDSESAYSGAMRQLEQAKSDKTAFNSLVDSHRKELEELRDDLQSTKQALVLMDSHQLLVDENRELTDKVKMLEAALMTNKQECTQFNEQLSELTVAMETAQEELAMIKLTIAEKDHQLLHTQDQLLGLRQCLAHLLSELRPSGTSHDITSYSLAGPLVNKLHSLVNDGNVDKFLLETSNSESNEHSLTLDATLTETRQEEVEADEVASQYELLRESGSGVSNPVITPLNLTAHHSSDVSTLTPSHHLSCDLSQSKPPVDLLSKASSPLTSSVAGRGVDNQSCVTTSSEVEFRNDLASLDADIARLQIQFRVALQANSD